MSKEVKLNKITTSVIRDMKKKGAKITMLTAYDYSMAAVLDEAGVDILLVGDSLGMVGETRMKTSMSGSSLSHVPFATEPSTCTSAVTPVSLHAESTLASSFSAKAVILSFSPLLGVIFLEMIAQTLLILSVMALILVFVFMDKTL